MKEEYKADGAGLLAGVPSARTSSSEHTLKYGRFCLNIRKQLFTSSRQEVVGVSFLAVTQAIRVWTLFLAICIRQPLLLSLGVDKMTSRGLFQPKPTQTILWYASDITA